MIQFKFNQASDVGLAIFVGIRFLESSDICQLTWFQEEVWNQYKKRKTTNFGA